MGVTVRDGGDSNGRLLYIMHCLESLSGAYPSLLRSICGGYFMEQEKAKDIAQVSSTENLQAQLTEYKVYEHPLLPKKIIKIGFCWPAIIIGPAYLLYRRLWIPVVIWIVAILLAHYLDVQFVVKCDNCNYISPEDQSTIDNVFNGALFIGIVVLGIITNSLWEKDLINRGYITTKSLRARSMDDALAIIEREKNSP